MLQTVTAFLRVIPREDKKPYYRLNLANQHTIQSFSYLFYESNHTHALNYYPFSFYHNHSLFLIFTTHLYQSVMITFIITLHMTATCSLLHLFHLIKMAIYTFLLQHCRLWLKNRNLLPRSVVTYAVVRKGRGCARLRPTFCIRHPLCTLFILPRHFYVRLLAWLSSTI